MSQFDISHIPCRFLERRRMKAARSWRCFIELPDDSMLAVGLTSLIESQVSVRITAKLQTGDVEAVIDPAYIVDVPSKGKRFQIVIETVSELQSDIGPTLTAMTGESIILCIQNVGEPPAAQQAEEQRRGTIDEKTLRGLHVVFFKNPKFQEFVAVKANRVFTGSTFCKDIFKEHMNVKSCTEIDQADFDAFLNEFNQWLNGGTCG